MADLISREALLDALPAVDPLKDKKVSLCGCVADMIALVMDAPAVEAEPVRHERWVGISYDGYADGSPVYNEWECSGCGEEHQGEDDTLPDYCPGCGAKMDGEEPDE